jgi:hypothetical protein
MMLRQGRERLVEIASQESALAERPQAPLDFRNFRTETAFAQGGALFRVAVDRFALEFQLDPEIRFDASP